MGNGIVSDGAGTLGRKGRQRLRPTEADTLEIAR